MNFLSSIFFQVPKVFKQQIITSHSDTFIRFRALRYNINYLRLKGSTVDEISQIISHLVINKSCGHDNLSPKTLFECNREISPLLVNLFNDMLETSAYPYILKISKIISNLKESGANVEETYRPISLLSIVDKVFEKIIYRQPLTENNKLIYESQYCFRKGSGTENAVTNVVNYICNVLDQGFRGIVGMFYEFSKEFGAVDH